MKMQGFVFPEASKANSLCRLKEKQNRNATAIEGCIFKREFKGYVILRRSFKAESPLPR